VRRLVPRSPLAISLSLIAIFLSIGSGAYAASALGSGAVQTRNLASGAVTGSKLARGAVSAQKLDNSLRSEISPWVHKDQQAFKDRRARRGRRVLLVLPARLARQGQAPRT